MFTNPKKPGLPQQAGGLVGALPPSPSVAAAAPPAGAMQDAAGVAAAAAAAVTTDLQSKVYLLQQQLAAREQEVAALREIAEAASELQSQDVQAAKVIELSRKNRAMNLQLEKERHKVAKLQQALSEAAQQQQQQQQLGRHGDTVSAAGAAGGPSAAEHEERGKELSTCKGQLQQMTNRMAQMEQKVFLLEGENRKLVRTLVREVGDDVPLARLLQDSDGTACAGWKGRREQILALKATVRQLKEAAAAAAAGGGGGGGSGGGGGGAGGGAATGSAAGGSTGASKHESAHRAVIGKLNKAKDAELQRLVGELDAAKAAAEALRLQFTGASSRRKVLEAEVAGLKDKLSVVLGKTQNDDKLIQALRAELAAASMGAGGSAGAGRLGGAAGAPSAGPRAAYSFELSQQRCGQLEEQVEQQQKIIRYLQAQLHDAQKGAAAGSPKAPPQQQPQSARALQQECAGLRQQLEALRLAPGAPAQQQQQQQQQCASDSTAAPAALQQQVLSLQDDNAALRAQLHLLQGPQSPLALALSREDRQVLAAAKEALTLDGGCSDGDGAVEVAGEYDDEEEEEDVGEGADGSKDVEGGDGGVA